jgi:predicted extracellular nuclease
MAKTIRVGTFNVENLFARYRFKSNTDPETAVRDGWTADKRRFTIQNETSKKITAKTIKALKADLLALQEVENLDTLKRFRSRYLGGRRAYPHALVVDGNDPRLIDVAILSKLPVVHVRSHQHLWDTAGRAPVFSRDCLEVDVQVTDTLRLTLYINHLKSMLDKGDPCNGRRNTRARRSLQARKVREIVTARFGPRAGDHPFVVLGDLNDYLEEDRQGRSGIDDLVGWDQVVNVAERLPADERWTHFFKGSRRCGIEASYRQLDYVLVSRALAAANSDALPVIERRGMPRRAARADTRRFEGVGRNRPKASDHCPLVIDLTLG